MAADFAHIRVVSSDIKTKVKVSSLCSIAELNNALMNYNKALTVK